MISQWRYFFLLIVLFSVTNITISQEKYPAEQFSKFVNYYSKGDFLSAEKCLRNIEEQKDFLSKEYIIALYNNLGVINNRLGRYDEALKYLNQAESNISVEKETSSELADIYINKARIYGIKREYNKAIALIEQGVIIYLNFRNPNKNILSSLSSAYLNLGLTYYEINNYDKALLFLIKSKDIKQKNNLSELAFTYLNIAKTYDKINDVKRAHKYFLESIASFNDEFGKEYYRLSEAYFDYGLFLNSIGKNDEAFEVHKKALSICLKNYGEKHTLVSLAYKHLGDFFYDRNDFQKALEFYQKSIIAVVVDFDNPDIAANPSLNSVLFDIRLLENLKSKAKALEAYSNEQKADKDRRLFLLKNSFTTIDLALQLISRIRRDYITTESRLYLAENEKKTYFFAVHLANKLFELTNDNFYKEQMYSITCLSKAAILRNEIAENKALEEVNSNDSLKTFYRKLLIDIVSYAKLIDDENVKRNPDSVKVDFWKTSLFKLNQQKEKIFERLKELYPSYAGLSSKLEPLALGAIQSQLKKDQTIIEYFLSNNYVEGKRDLYVFVVSENNLTYHFVKLDSLFERNTHLVKEGTSFRTKISNKDYINALYYMYATLLEPVEQYLKGKKIIVVPDEEIAFLPFDAFIKQKPYENQVAFDELQYLVYDYSISYGYTSSLISDSKIKKYYNPTVYTFLPEYDGSQSSRFQNLFGANSEVSSLSKWFKTRNFSKDNASESNFKSNVSKYELLHLAMHSESDPKDSKYSYLVFDRRLDSLDDGRLYNYEISSISLESPMVVLSACNTGVGDLYQGEGVMSLTRSFFLAGASSVISTFWDVNDDASAKIMSDFYKNLSKGEDKCEALRQAKLNYLANTPPIYTSPSYWAAYEVFGDTSPVKKSKTLWLLFLIGIVSTGGFSLVYYFKRFRRS